MGPNWKVTGGKVEGHRGELRAPGAVPAPAVIPLGFAACPHTPQ